MAFWALVFSMGFGHNAQAQSPDDVVWVQVEAISSLTAATNRAKEYAAQLQDVNGFALGGPWYGVVIGPYRRADAELVLRSYRRDGVIPRDSFIQQTVALRQQFWPVGANVLNRGVLDAPTTETPVQAAPETPVADTQTAQVTQEPEVALEPEAEPEAADETPQEAQRSERALSRDGRKDLQIALKWGGFYTAAIDGSFGRGTRNSMAAWQLENGYTQTGILTTLQREVLFKQYNAVLEGMDLALLQDRDAGIEMLVPLGVVAFDKYEPPFAHYTATGDVAAQLLLISQPGDQNTLFGLYEIMQTLDIVPLEGPRTRKKNSFELVGTNNRIVSHTEVSLQRGEIKGFTLVWPAGDEARRTRVLEKMRASFARIDGVLSPAAGTTTEQSIDLVSGLAIRKPIRARSGFFITGSGVVATTSDAVQNCGRVTLDHTGEAQVIANNTALGLALVKPNQALSPLAFADLGAAEPRLNSEVALAGYSFDGVLSAPSTSFGTLADVRGLDGNTDLARLNLASRAGDAGGPVLDQLGATIGMLITRETSGAQLPADVSITLDAAIIATEARAAGLSLPSATATQVLTPFQLSKRATDMTVLVSCWE